jgi:hypothetical protein
MVAMRPAWGDFRPNYIRLPILEEGRAIATRYEKTASSFMGVLSLAATLDWRKS